MKKGTIDLSEGLYVPAESGVQAKRQICSIQMKSTDLSAETTFSLELSAGDGVWSAALDGSGEAVTGALVANTPKLLSYELDPALEYRVKFASGNTGNISYIIME